MKVWITRPTVSEVVVKGTGRCVLWIVKPVFNHTPRGDTDLPIYAALPIGWQVIDDNGFDMTGQAQMDIGKRLDPFGEVEQALWKAMVADIDGLAPDATCYRRWMADPDLLYDSCGDESFLFEWDAPPHVWWRLAIDNGLDIQTWKGHWFQSLSQGEQLPF